MKSIGITGQNGFVGYHLYQSVKLLAKEFQIIEFERNFFEDQLQLDEFVAKCEIIVHLAALNRHNDANEIYSTNVLLVEKLVAALERTNSKAHIIISSSIQEEQDNLYGKSKREGRLILSKWASSSGGKLTGLIIPNVFGPFGKPYYNSVIATFCHQLSHNETPKIEVNSEIKLIYVLDLVEEILSVINKGMYYEAYNVPHRNTISVFELLAKLEYYRDTYQKMGQIPMLKNTFDYQLFNTYRCYMDIATYFPRKYQQHPDNRGTFTELLRSEVSGQFSFSTTVPGITRGNHFHTRKIERFSVIKGKARIELRRIGTDKVITYLLDGDEPSYVDMPIWFTHNITNIGSDILYTCFWINEPFNPNDPDTYLETV